MSTYDEAKKKAVANGDQTFTYNGARYRAGPLPSRTAVSFGEGGAVPPPAVRPQARPELHFWNALQETADALQVPVEELATIISYETAGSMNPLQPGPVTDKWGQHRGYIQFGEPQAKQYGVDFSSAEAAARSQLGKDGAIVKYALAHGFKPGEHNPLQLYATINAGNPNKTGARDAAAGGAPGTVAEKYYTQMAAHRRKVAASMGKSSGPDPMEWGHYDTANRFVPRDYPHYGSAPTADQEAANQERRQRDARAYALNVLGNSMKTQSGNVMGPMTPHRVEAAQMLAIPEN